MARHHRLKILTAVFLIVLVTGGVYAQTRNQGDGAVPREIYTALAFGEAIFEPDIWLASASEKPDRTTAEWRADPLLGLAFLDYLHFDDGITPEDADAFFTSDWFEVTFSSYQSWEKRATCVFDNHLTLREFAFVFDDAPYTMRYWTQYINENRVSALFLLLPSDQPELMETYAERLYPAGYSCGMNS
ncbi:MAG: hypothetical protein H6672_04015 [Anaerolineaceae bacterium]|nr:hypothetical protein [Anaerolineaceae bacterium]